MALEIHVDRHADDQPPYSILSLDGRIDFISAQEFKAAIENEIGTPENRLQNPPALIIDLHETEYLSTAGLRELAITRKALGILRIANPNSHVSNVLELSGLSRTLSIFATQDEAKEDIQDPQSE